jgi:superfamily II DNA/RNA helicase
MNSFSALGVDTCFIEKLKERSITEPTAIQNLIIPRLLAGKSVVFSSATGTGKTFAYLLPLLQQEMKNTQDGERRGLSILICAPTLELCSQIKAEIDFLSAQSGIAQKLNVALLIGSINIEKQIESIKRKKPVIVVGNPGRLFMLAKMKKINLRSLRFLILDEADRLTAQDCLDDTKGLLSLIEREAKQADGLCLGACSATTGKKTCSQLGSLFKDVEIIESSEHEILRERIEHWAIFSEKRRKVQTLRSLLAALKGKKSKIKVLVFTSRNDEAGKILSQLQYHHLSAAGLFGKMNKKPISGEQRKEALDSFREGRVDILVSTDLAARGLDVPGITHVIALDVPSDGEAYIHRCGRTGRAGKRGTMITVGDETQMRLLASLEKKLKIRIQPKELYEGRICVPPQE